METRNLGSLLVAIGGLFLGVFVAIDVVGGGNSIGNLYLYFAIGALVIGVIRPVMGLYATVIMSGYLDFLKRLLVVGGSVNWNDIIYILSIAPIMVGGVAIGVTIPFLLGQKAFTKKHVILYGAAVAFFLVNSAMLMKGGNLGPYVLRELANRGAYATLIFIVPEILQDSDSVRRFLRVTIITYIPVMLYLFHQSLFGIADWEYDYLMSGFSLEARQLRARVFRPFSTMNAAANVSTMLAIMAVLALVPLKRLKGWRFGDYFNGGRLALAACFSLGAFLTYSRGGWFCGLVALAGTIMFRRAIGVWLAYGMGVFLIFLVILGSGWMLKADALARGSEGLVTLFGGSDEAVMATKLGTFDARLRSYQELLTNSKYWSPFGVIISGEASVKDLMGTDFEDEFYNHDAITELLLTFGYVPLGALGLLSVYLLLRVHRGILAIGADDPLRGYAVYSVAAIVGILAGSVANAAQWKTYPVNLFLWLFIALLVTIFRIHGNRVAQVAYQRQKQKEAAGAIVGAIQAH